LKKNQNRKLFFL